MKTLSFEKRRIFIGLVAVGLLSTVDVSVLGKPIHVKNGLPHLSKDFGDFPNA